MGLIIVFIFVGLVISYILAEEFVYIAKKKGFSDKRYFWFCFLFGIIGYLMVVALPDRKEDMLNDIVKIEEKATAEESVNKVECD